MVSNVFMLVWTQVFRARLTGGRHARFAVTHETLLVRALVSYVYMCSMAAVYWDAQHIDEGVRFLKQHAQPHA